jgi:hypothetical protein
MTLTVSLKRSNSDLGKGLNLTEDLSEVEFC